jgi:hypothetical protein
MKFKEKLIKELEKIAKNSADDSIPDVSFNSIVDEQSKIADEFAIGFADWIRVCKLKGRPYDFENTQELLVIYKEEKDL